MKYSIRESWLIAEGLLLAPAIIVVSIGIIQVVKWLEGVGSLPIGLVIGGAIFMSFLYVISMVVNHLEEQ